MLVTLFRWANSQPRLNEASLSSIQYSYLCHDPTKTGDFLFNENDVESMLEDIEAAKEAGLDGIVIGALTPMDTLIKISANNSLLPQIEWA